MLVMISTAWVLSALIIIPALFGFTKNVKDGEKNDDDTCFFSDSRNVCKIYENVKDTPQTYGSLFALDPTFTIL